MPSHTYSNEWRGAGFCIYSGGVRVATKLSVSDNWTEVFSWISTKFKKNKFLHRLSVSLVVCLSCQKAEILKSGGIIR